MCRRPATHSLASWAFIASVATSVPAAPPLPPEHGLRGLRQLQLAFVDVTRAPRISSEFTPRVAATDPGAAREPSPETGATRDFAREAECRAIGPALSRAGIEIVDHCRHDDTACGTLYLTMESYPIAGSDDRIYMVAVELAQRAQLLRDPTIELSAAITWTEQRVGTVQPHNSATIASCMSLHDLTNWFSSLWKDANR